MQRRRFRSAACVRVANDAWRRADDKSYARGAVDPRRVRQVRGPAAPRPTRPRAPRRQPNGTSPSCASGFPLALEAPSLEFGGGDRAIDPRLARNAPVPPALYQRPIPGHIEPAKASKGRHMVPTMGAKAPAFTLPRDGGGSMSLADFKGRKLVLYFY